MKEVKNDPLFEAWRKALHMDSAVRGLLDPAITEGGTVEARKDSTSEAALWLLGRHCIVIEGYDDNNFYYYIPAEVAPEVINECHAYWADEAARLDDLRKEFRRLRVEAIAKGFDAAGVMVPGAEGDAESWELYLREYRRQLSRFDRLQTSPAPASPVSLPPKEKKGGGCAVLSLLAMFVFAVFLAYACFIR